MPVLPPSCSLVALESVGSTSDHARMLAKSGYPHATIVWAKAQTAGRGRHGNAWDSRPGNLFMSVVLRPDVNAALTGQLSFVCAVALARALKRFTGGRIGLKWPNDVLLDGKKVAGILLETEPDGVRPVQWVVAGIGVNVADAPEGAAFLGGGATAEGVLEALAAELMALYAAWRDKGFGAAREEWLSMAVRIGEEISVRLPRETFSGVFRGLDESGALEVELPGGVKRVVTSGEVFI